MQRARHMGLDRRRLAREHAEAVSFGMAGQIDQDIDAIGADLLGQAIVAPLRGVAPAIGDLLEFLGRRIHLGRARVAHDLELIPVMAVELCQAKSGELRRISKKSKLCD